jgi:hypothetical protein
MNYLSVRSFYESNLESNNVPITALIRTDALRAITPKWPQVFDPRLAHGLEDWDMWLRMKEKTSTAPLFPNISFGIAEN